MLVPIPPSSTPVTWDEVDACATSANPNDLRFISDDVLKRLDDQGDLLAPLLATLTGTTQKRK